MSLKCLNQNNKVLKRIIKRSFFKRIKAGAYNGALVFL